MSGFSQALMEDYGEHLQGDAVVYMEHIINASKSMANLIDGLLRLSRSNRGELSNNTVNLSPMAEHILTELSNSEPSRRVSWHIEPDLVTRGDSKLLESVLNNLIGNAWKYTGNVSVPQINVFSEQRDGSLFYCVSDNGSGFNMEHYSLLFKPFQRLHRQDEFPGIGIGLATVQRIIHRHGGTICAEAEQGKGATFRFTLHDEN
jgi:light-regulated signal transduction histidine kinase (bacteriophytochrome)